MKRTLLALFAAAILLGCHSTNSSHADFVRRDGMDLRLPSGEKLFIRGTNLGQWLNPEGYMFGFKRTNSVHLIDEMLREAVGPDFTDDFWTKFKQNYITAEDIHFIASTGANVIRLPFHYKLFTTEPYMGSTDPDEGFTIIDRVVEWCRKEGLYLILDMHDAPGGQTGDNIDDSYGYPYLVESPRCQQQFCQIWQRIASHYKNEAVILGYELLNEPIAHFFENKEELNTALVEVYRKGVAAIREIDRDHIILLGGTQWNSVFTPLEECDFDEQIIYTCHRYGGGATKEAIASFIDFRDRHNRPMYMGEIGHNTYEWYAEFCQTMRENNIGYTFWPYKKIGSSSWVGFRAPEGWDEIVRFAEGPRGSYAEIRANRPDAALARKALTELLENIKFRNCTPDREYIHALGLHAE